MLEMILVILIGMFLLRRLFRPWGGGFFGGWFHRPWGGMWHRRPPMDDGWGMGRGPHDFGGHGPGGFGGHGPGGHGGGFR